MSSSLQPTTAALLALRDQLPLARLADRPRLTRELNRLFARRTPGADLDQAIQSLQQATADSLAHVQRLRALPLRLDFAAVLPITAHREEIVQAMQANQVLVVCGATGSGKTTQLPKLCLAAGRGAVGLIGHTQPRRIAARALASRLAEELDTQVGGAVGCQVRFSDRSGPDCRVKLMTDGILLRELERDRQLRRYDTLIIDEAHERTLNIDFLLGVLQRVLPERPDLKLIITSATIDPQRFASFFAGAPVIEVSGRSYPVEVRYRPLTSEAEDSELSLPEGIVAAVRELDQAARGDVLVFLPGEKQIRDAAEVLQRAGFPHTEILPLYARLSARDQERIFEQHDTRRIVLATNVAETSLTVPGIRHVIDSGLARISRYSVRGKVQRLPIEPISQASADQRKGRCGRQSEGICIRLYGEDDFNLRAEFTPPEVLRTNLASVILQMATLELGAPEEFPFVDAPDTRMINDGYRLLQELKAVDDSRRVTSLGRQIASLPVDPRLARMLIAADHHGCVTEMLTLAAFLAGQDPRERPAQAQQQADQRHAALADPRSDFIAVLNLWKVFHEQLAALSGNQLRRWCRENFLSYLRLREWQELRRQLGDVVEDLSLRTNHGEADYAQLHQAILTGFLGGIGTLDEKREYSGARGSRFVIAPGTPLASKPPKWLVAASLMETTRLYARMAAAVEPQWIEAAGAHLVKRSYSEPHWVRERGFVAAYESTALYGLTLSSRRRVNYGHVAAREAREIFVREALVASQADIRSAFLRRNRELQHQVEVMEAKIRRRDILVDEQALCDFYLERLPPDIHSTQGLLKWLGEPNRHEASVRQDRRTYKSSREHKPAPRPLSGVAPDVLLSMTLEDLMSRTVPEITAVSHPDFYALGSNRLPLHYRFEPGSAADGITLVVPEPLLNSLDEEQLAWMIPGWRVAKIVHVLRALPKHVRKLVVPVPEHAERAAAELEATMDFHAALAAWITRATGQGVQPQELAKLPLPEHLRFNLRIVDLSGAVLHESRDLTELRRELRRDRSRTGEAAKVAASTRHRSWAFGELPRQQTVRRGDLQFVVHPALRDCGDGVEPVQARSESEADGLLRQAVLRLAILALPEQYKYARKRFSEQRDLMLLGQGMSTSKPLPDGLAERAFELCFLADDSKLPRNDEEFAAMLDRRRADFGNVLDGMIEHVTEILRAARLAREKLSALSNAAFRPVTEDASAQMRALLSPQFPLRVPQELWPHLPRFLKALVRRLDKAAGQLKRDAQQMQRLAPFARAFQDLSSSDHRGDSRCELDRLHWMIEEFRVSLFAQDLRTALPVSEKRLAEQVEKAREEAKK